MEVKLSNGQELTALGVRGEPVFFQGQSRDCLTFVFDPEQYGIEELDRHFTPENCERITLRDGDGNEFVHTGYVIRKGLAKGPEDRAGGIGGAAGSAPPNRITVAMAQRTYLEQTQADLAEAVDLLIINSLEV